MPDPILTGAAPGVLGRAYPIVEHETDVITHRCVEALHKTFITPIDRDDIHRLITRMDDIMDFVEAGAERIALYEIGTMTADIRDLADVLVRGKVNVFQQEGATMAAAVDVRLPTGRDEDLLGAGKASVRGAAIGSIERARTSAHARAAS